MQDFRDKVATFNFICARFVMGYPCVRHFVLYSWYRYFALFLSYVKTKIPEIQNGRLAAILKLFPSKGELPRLADIAEHLNYQIKR